MERITEIAGFYHIMPEDSIRSPSPPPEAPGCITSPWKPSPSPLLFPPPGHRSQESMGREQRRSNETSTGSLAWERCSHKETVIPALQVNLCKPHIPERVGQTPNMGSLCRANNSRPQKKKKGVESEFRGSCWSGSTRPRGCHNTGKQSCISHVQPRRHRACLTQHVNTHGQHTRVCVCEREEANRINGRNSWCFSPEEGSRAVPGCWSCPPWIGITKSLRILKGNTERSPTLASCVCSIL